MCLAIPMTIVKIDGSTALAVANGVETQVNIAMTPDIKINEKVLVHAGFVIEKLDEEQAREIVEQAKARAKEIVGAAGQEAETLAVRQVVGQQRMPQLVCYREPLTLGGAGPRKEDRALGLEVIHDDRGLDRALRVH